MGLGISKFSLSPVLHRQGGPSDDIESRPACASAGEVRKMIPPMPRESKRPRAGHMRRWGFVVAFPKTFGGGAPKRWPLPAMASI